MKTPEHIIIDGDAISIRPSEAHEYLVTTKEVARGYGVSDALIRKHKENHADELIEGKHWVVNIIHTLGGEQSATFWTKRGVIRLGFFIRSERAKRFRDAAEDLILRIATGESVEVRRADVDHIAAGFAALSRTVEHIAQMQGRLILGQSHLQDRLERAEQQIARLEGRALAAMHAEMRPPQPAPLTEEEALAEALRLTMGYESMKEVRAAAVTAIIARYGLPVPLSQKQPANSLGKRLAAGVELRTRDGQTVRVSPRGRNRHRRYILRRGVTPGAN